MIRRVAALVFLLTSLCGGEVISADIFRVHYEVQDSAIAEYSLQILVDSRKEFEKRFVGAPDAVTVRICGNYDEFAAYAGPLATQSVVGVAKLNENLIALKTPRIAPQGADYKGTVRHELAHILLHHNTDPDNVPRWLHEGVAMVLSGENRWASRATVATMYLNGRTLSYRDLEASFLEPGQEMEFGEAYAQAFSMTQYLIRELGEESFWSLIGSLESRSFGTALQAELGMIPHDFAVAWKRSLGWTAVVYSIISGLSVFQIMAILTIAAYWRRRRNGLVKLRQWEVEEAADD